MAGLPLYVDLSRDAPIWSRRGEPVAQPVEHLTFIRGDLEERVFLIEAQIAATSTDFENAVEQLKNKLRADIASLGVALLAEQYRNYLADTIPGDGPQ